MMLLTKPIRTELEANYMYWLDGADTSNLKPVVKFFGGSACTWLITEYDPETELMFGLCDVGHGFPELGYVSFAELKAIRFPPFGLPLERDMHWEPRLTLAEYAEEARGLGYIKS